LTIAPTFSELEKMSDEELRRKHDEIAAHTQVGLAWYRDEIARRQLAGLTKTLVRLTWVITVLTTANVVLVALTFVRG
jgi:hypothetical protein